jgi:hypothetical protein
MTLAKDEYNIVVGGVSLSNPWRKTTTGIVISRDDSSTVKSAAIEFCIEAENEAQLAERWKITESELNNKWIDAYGYRTNSDAKIFDWSPGDGEVITLTSIVSMLPQEPQTGFSIFAYLAIAVEMTGPRGGGSIIPGEEGRFGALFIEFNEIYESSRLITRSASGAFAFKVGDADTGPFTITGIVDSGGLTRINVSETITFIGDGFASINGTLRYNGKHGVTSVGSNFVVINKAFEGGESAGTLFLGNVEMAEDVYLSNRRAILDELGVGNEDENMTLVSEHKVTIGDGTMEFILVAQQQDFVPGGLGDGDTQAVKKISMHVNIAKPEEWALREGETAAEIPDLITIEGAAVLDRRVVGSDPSQLWGDIETEVLQKAADMEKISAPTVIARQLRFDPVGCQLVFNLACMGNWSGVMEYKIIFSHTTHRQTFVFPVGNDTDGIQFDRSNKTKTVQITQNLVSVDRDEDFEDETKEYHKPEEDGFEFLHLDASWSITPVHVNDVGEVFVHWRQDVYLRVKLEAGA